MKTFFTYIGTAILAVITSACSNVGGTRINNGASVAGYKTRTEFREETREVTPQPTVGLEVFGSQPSEPTTSARANRTTWGETNGGLAYNEIKGKGYARLETPDSSTPVFIDRTTGWIWKVGCYNRLVSARTRIETVSVPHTVQEPILAQNGGGDVRVDNSVRVDTGLTALVNGAVGIAGRVLDEGLVYQPIPGRHYHQPSRPCPPPQIRPRPPQRPPQVCPPQSASQRTYVRYRTNNINHNVNVRNAPRDYHPSGGGSYGGSYRGSSGTSRAGFAPGNPGLKYY